MKVLHVLKNTDRRQALMQVYQFGEIFYVMLTVCSVNDSHLILN